MPRADDHAAGRPPPDGPAGSVEDVVLSTNRAAEALLQEDVYRRGGGPSGERMAEERRREILDKMRARQQQSNAAEDAKAAADADAADSGRRASAASAGSGRYNTQAERNRLVEQLLAQHGLDSRRSSASSVATSAVRADSPPPAPAPRLDSPPPPADELAEGGLFGDNVFEAAALLPPGAPGTPATPAPDYPAGATTLAWGGDASEAAVLRARAGGPPSARSRARAPAPAPAATPAAADLVGAMFPSEPEPEPTPRTAPRPTPAPRTTRPRATPSKTTTPSKTPAKPKTANKAALSRLAKGQSSVGAPPARHSKQSVKERLEKERERECTFKPRINRRRGGSRKPQVSGDDRIRMLAQSRAQVYERREAEKRAREEAELKEQCPFRPQAQRRPPGVEAAEPEPEPQPQAQDEPAADRLHNEAVRRAEQRERAKAAVDSERHAQFSYRPRINPETYRWLDVTRYRPIHERVGELQREKTQQLQQLRSRKEREDADLTFQPAISQRSAQLAESARVQEGALDVTARLMHDAAASTQRKIRLQVAYETEQQAENSFQPAISRRSQAIVAERAEFQQRSFVERQAVLQKRADARVRQRQHEKEGACSFQPDVGNAEAILSQTRPARLRETQEEQAERLAHRDAKARELKRQALLRQEREATPFAPQLNDVSRSIGRPSTLDELVADERGQRSRDAAKARQEDELRRQCSFRPKLNQESRRQAEAARSADSRFHIDLANPEDITRKIAKYKSERDEKIEATRRAREFEELQECTFMPETNAGSPSAAAAAGGPVIVRGLGRFLELRDMAKRLEDDKAERERKAFAVKYRSRSSTRAEPFKLTDRSAAAERRARLAKEVHDAEMAECTFRPKTLEGTNRRLLHDIMNDAEGESV